MKKKRRHFKLNKEQKIAAQQIPKYLQMAYDGPPQRRCLTHIVVLPGELEESAALPPTKSANKDHKSG